MKLRQKLSIKSDEFTPPGARYLGEPCLYYIKRIITYAKTGKCILISVKVYLFLYRKKVLNEGIMSKLRTKLKKFFRVF